MDTSEEHDKKKEDSIDKSTVLKGRMDDLRLRNEQLQEIMKKSTFDITQLPQRPKDDE